MSLYRRPDSEIWWADIRHAGRRVRRSTGQVDRAAAKKVHDAFHLELLQLVPVVNGRTWGEAVDLWLTAEERSDSEIQSLAKFARQYPDRALNSVDRDSVDRALSFCGTAGTYTRYRSMIAAILNAARRAGWINTVPTLATRRDKKKKPREWITPEQWRCLYAELPAHMKPMAEFAIETGLRQANVLGLTWAHVDLERELVWIEAEDAKSGEALSIPLNERALDVLNAAKGTHSEFVFTYRGRPIKEIKTAFIAACLRAGLGQVSAQAGYSGFTWHGLRHTWATWHIQNGTPLDVLQKLGGWSDLRMVMNYAHHAPGYIASFAGNTRKKTVDQQGARHA